MLPIINRGTWARVFSVRSVITRFLAAFKESERIQILSLGAGFDITYFWLRDQFPSDKNLKYFEVDFNDVVEKKIQMIQKTEALWKNIWDDLKDI